MFWENFSDDGNLLYGDALDNTGVPKCTDLMEDWFDDFCTGVEVIVICEDDVFKSLLIDSSRQSFTESWLVFRNS